MALGYSRFDSLLTRTKNNALQKNAPILIAPSWGEQGVIESGLGLRLVDELIEGGYHVILRPHPQILKFTSGRVQEIVKKYKARALFSCEDHVAGQESLHDSQIMISDWSGAALEYALALKKPVIFCDVPKKINNPHYQDIDLQPLEVSIREKIGVIWDCEKSILLAIKECEKISTTQFDKVAKQYVYNIGNSDNVFAKEIISLLNS